MPYTIVSNTAGGYDILDGNEPAAALTLLSNNEALLKVVGGGKSFVELPSDFYEALKRGEMPETYLTSMMKSAISLCSCDICPPKKSGGCIYKKSAE